MAWGLASQESIGQAIELETQMRFPCLSLDAKFLLQETSSFIPGAFNW
jgi:hypothetical protein